LPPSGHGRSSPLLRDQWRSENRTHGVRAVTVDEDRALVRPARRSPPGHAARRNTAISILGAAGTTHSAADRHDAAQPDVALALITPPDITPENDMTLGGYVRDPPTLGLSRCARKDDQDEDGVEGGRHDE